MTTLAQFITSATNEIASEWEEFARKYLPAASSINLQARRDHVVGMLQRIAQDLDTPQTKREQSDKSKGMDDGLVTSATAANAHGTDRAAHGFTPTEVIAEFRALRASVLRLWSEAQGEFSRANLTDVMRFNEAIDQLLAESMSRYALDVENSKDLFLGVLGHDLRNPLGAIMMSASVMMTQEGPEWSHYTTASRILNAGTRMDQLIGDLVDFTRSKLGAGIPISRTACDLEQVARQTVEEIRAFHPECVVRFDASGNLRGDWDGGRIGQALSNLLGNAFQHGAPSAPIEVGVRGYADDVVVTVRNLGKRIPHERLSDIFEPFKQVEPAGAKSRDTRSFGLGLYIVRAIVTAHEGTIGVDSTELATTFTVRLPRSAR